jgi:hypothetical protein
MGSLSDLAVMASASLYGFEDYHGGRRGGAGAAAPAGGHAPGLHHQPHRGGIHLRVVGGGRGHPRRGVGALGPPGAAPRGAESVQAARAVARRRREGAALDGVHRRRRQVLRHGLAQPEAVAAPPRSPAHHAALPHVGRRRREATAGALAAVAGQAGRRVRRQGLEGLVVQVPEHRPPRQLDSTVALIESMVRRNTPCPSIDFFDDNCKLRVTSR